MTGAMRESAPGTEKPLGMSSDLRLLASPPISVATASPLKTVGLGAELGDDGAPAWTADMHQLLAEHTGVRSLEH